MNSVLTNRGNISQNTAIVTSAGTALDPNRLRVRGRIQNLGTNPLFVKFGASASATDFTLVLPANTVADNGTSAPYEFSSYTGLVTVAGTTPRFVASEDKF